MGMIPTYRTTAQLSLGPTSIVQPVSHSSALAATRSLPTPEAGSPAKAGGSIPSVHTHWGRRGDAALPFEPPGLSRRCRSSGRTGAQPPNPRTGARKAQRRTAVVAADLTPAEQVAFDQAAEALRLPNAGERAHEAVSGVRELLAGPPASPSRTAPPTEAPPVAWTRRRRGRKPSRRDHSRRRRGLGRTSEP